MSTPRAWVGIDPGASGAVAEISPAGTVRFYDTPFLLEKQHSGKRSPDDIGMASILRTIRDGNAAVGAEVFVVLEKVNAMPAVGPGGTRRAVGTSSMFNFGTGYGIWRGALAFAEIPNAWVSPMRWKKAVLFDAPKSDGAAAGVAGRLYPAAAAQLRGPKGGLLMGRVDALLLAHYGLSVLGATG